MAKDFVLTASVDELSEEEKFVGHTEVLDCECVTAQLFVQTATFSVAAFKIFCDQLPIGQAFVCNDERIGGGFELRNKL